MVGRADSKPKQRKNFVELTEKYTQRAIDLYKDVQEQGPVDLGNGKKGKGFASICKKVIADCYAETKKNIKLTASTLRRRVNGGRSIAQFNTEKCLLTKEEEKLIVNYAITQARRGFPPNQQRLREHANDILTARLGLDFAGVGENWVERFLLRHDKDLSPYWSHSLDHSRARAVNPHNHVDYFGILKKALDGSAAVENGYASVVEPILNENIYAADETGLQKGIGVRQRVYGPAGVSIQHEQQSGDRENITVIVTICADGTSQAPAVIYKGEKYQASWAQDNPLNASLGYSKKGYTDGEIGVEWIKHFDKETRQKARGRRRVLLVDGHNSHYTKGFLEYAVEHDIDVVCYPSHSTHIYQGLDVIIFSILKQKWTEHCDAFEKETGTAVSKSNFLAVYAKAHTEALTPENIQAAFRKTGVVPYDPSVVTPEMMAPSTATSTDAVLPIVPSSPERVIIDQLAHEWERQNLPSDDTMDLDSDFQTRPSTPETLLNDLGSTSMSFLTSSSPIQSTSTLPHIPTMLISPIRKESRYKDLLDRLPATTEEAELQNALRECEARDEARKSTLLRQQAASVLNGQYIRRVQGQLQHAEQERAKKNNRKKVRKLGDGKARLLTSREFVQMVDEAQKAQEDEERNKEKRRKAREEHSTALAAWKKADTERVERNKVLRANHQAAVKAWESGGKKGSKPKLGNIERTIPRPKKPEMDEEEEDSDDGAVDE